jgi:hypothetical protein
VEIVGAQGCLTVAKHGLSDEEMEDLLSLDDAVLDDVFEYWVPPIRRIPPLLWIRLKSDLSDYLVTCGSHHVHTVTWSHQEWSDTCKNMYLQGNELMERHRDVARYFGGFEQDKITQRLVDPQPLWTCQDQNNEMPSIAKVMFNMRKLSELPRSLIFSKDFERVRALFLSNEFCEAKVCLSYSILKSFLELLIQNPLGCFFFGGGRGW